MTKLLEAGGGQVHESETFGKLPEPLLHDTDISDGAKVLFAHMHWRYGTNKRNFESQSSMAELLGVTEKTIARRITELENAGYIVVITRRGNETGNYMSHYYHVFTTKKECTEWRKQPRELPEGCVVRKPKTKKSTNKKDHKTNLSDGDKTKMSNGQETKMSDYLEAEEYLDSDISPADADTPTDAPDDLGVQLTATINGIPDSSYTVDELAAMYNVSTDVIWHNVVELAKANTIDLDSATKTAYPLGKKPKAPESVDDFSKIDWSMPFNDHESVKQAIEEHWNVHGGEASALASMLTYRPNAKYSEYTEDLKQANGGERLTSLDVKNFSEHWKATHDDGVELPRKASIVQSHLIGWIKAGKTTGIVTSVEANRYRKEV